MQGERNYISSCPELWAGFELFVFVVPTFTLDSLSMSAYPVLGGLLEPRV